MLYISYSMIDHFVKDLQIRNINIYIKRNCNYWVIKLKDKNICRFYGKKEKLCGIGFKQQNCSEKEWLYFINDTEHKHTVLMDNGFRGYKLHYTEHEISYYMDWFKEHIIMAILKDNQNKRDKEQEEI